jgi:uncharacterized protein YsxB (DUF464 family)
MKGMGTLLAASFYAFSCVAWADTTVITNSVDQAVSINQAGSQSQQTIDGLVDQTRTALDEYLALDSELNILNSNNRHLQLLIADQTAQLKSLAMQLDSIGETNNALTPMMSDMIETLELFVQLDIPFFPQERTERINRLKETFTRSDVTLATKYRSILEAFEIENDYGRTIESYRGELENSPNVRLVEFFRLGRVALYYQTIDELEAGIWNNTTKQWQQLDTSTIPSIKDAIAMAKKRSAPDLLYLPIPSPVSAEADEVQP